MRQWVVSTGALANRAERSARSRIRRHAERSATSEAERILEAGRVAHVAYALGTPAVTIFGATDPARWGPPPGPQYRVLVNPVPCWPCDYWECPVGYRCLAGITVEQVVAAAQEVLRAKRAETIPES